MKNIIYFYTLIAILHHMLQKTLCFSVSQNSHSANEEQCNRNMALVYPSLNKGNLKVFLSVPKNGVVLKRKSFLFGGSHARRWKFIFEKTIA